MRPRSRDPVAVPRGSRGLLVAVSVFLVGGGAAAVAGKADLGDALWVSAGALGVGLSLVTIVVSLCARHLGVDVIALVALVGAIAVREYLAGAVISVMLATGRVLEEWAGARARQDLASLVRRTPTSARRYRDGAVESVPLEAVRAGDRLLVATGAVVPVDGTVHSARAVLDEAAMTGEPLPVTRAAGARVSSGVVNAGAPFDLMALGPAAESDYAQIVRLVEGAEATPAPFVRLADRFAVGFLAVTALATGAAWWAGGATRAVAVLVVATPCPMILAAPAAFVAGLSRAARRGIIVRSGAVLERLAGVRTVVLDKTGTVTQGRPELARILVAPGWDAREVLALAASVDQISPHVVAESIVHAAQVRECPLALPEDAEESPGSGARGRVAGRWVAVGGESYVRADPPPPWARGARRQARRAGALSVWVSVDGAVVGILELADPPRPEAARTIRALRASGVRRVVLLTGDRADLAEGIGAVIGVDEVLADRSPAEKLDAVARESARAATAMVGDGINDAPALALAHVGVAMGARGASAASEAADVVVMVDRLDRLVEALAVARRTRRIALESVAVGTGLSLIAMAVAGAGGIPAVAGAVLQECIDAAVIVNALRARSAGTDADSARLPAPASQLGQQFRQQHRDVVAVLDELGEAADVAEPSDAPSAIAAARRVYEHLVAAVLPHELAEEQVLYPVLRQYLGGRDPLGTMSRGHAEIAHRVRRLSQLLDDLERGGADAGDVVELRSMLYGLQAIIALHTAQEEESLLSLVET